MSAAQQFTKGDRVKVTLEATITGIVPFDGRVELRVTDDTGNTYYFVPDSGSVEKVEPPVEVFKPGDVVRERSVRDPGLRVLADAGYTNLSIGVFYGWGDSRAAIKSLDEFTPDRFERVAVG